MKKLITTLIIGFLLSIPVQAKEKKLNVKHYWQDDGCWCGVATTEMIEQFYRGDSWAWYPKRQTNLANPRNNGWQYVGNTRDGTYNNPCGKYGGLDGNEFPIVVNHRLKKLNKKLRYGLTRLYASSVDANYRESKTFHKNVISSINKNDLVVFSGHTRYKNGLTKKGQHWYLIIGYKDSDGNPNTISHNDGYYIHDSTVNTVGKYRNLRTLGKKGKFVSHFNMMKHLAERYSYKYGYHMIYYRVK